MFDKNGVRVALKDVWPLTENLEPEHRLATRVTMFISFFCLGLLDLVMHVGLCYLILPLFLENIVHLRIIVFSIMFTCVNAIVFGEFPLSEEVFCSLFAGAKYEPKKMSKWWKIPLLLISYFTATFVI